MNLDTEKPEVLAPLVTIILVNWERPSLTIECLESVFAIDYQNFVVIVCDNGSRDESLGEIQAWFETKAPISTIPRGSSQARRTDFALITLLQPISASSWQEHALLYLVNIGRNLGFGGGTNVGIQLSLANDAVGFVWILNNDTVVEPDSLSCMVERFNRDRSASMCGSRLLMYDRPDVVQALGGARFCPLTGESYLIGAGAPACRSVDPASVEGALDHLLGASMLVRRQFLEDVGLLEEKYFGYYEEIEWVTRARGSCKMVYADDSIVRHRVGASFGTSNHMKETTPMSAYFMTRSRMMFTIAYFPWAIPTVFLRCVLRGAWAFLRGYRGQAAAILAALLGRSPREALGWEFNTEIV